MTTNSPTIATLLLAAVAVFAAVGVSPRAATAATPTCFGHPATIVGTGERDVLVGSDRKRDVIVARGGDDKIIGAGGKDVICGGPGADEVHGGEEADRVMGGPGADRIEGDFGDDIIFGGPGADVLRGQGQDDVIEGGAGADVLIGGDSNDRLFGDGGDDVLAGDAEPYAGNDILDGGPGLDRLAGGGGCDQLWGRGGDDSLDGGSATNRCSYDPGQFMFLLDHLDFCRQGPGSGAEASCESSTLTDVVVVSVDHPEQVDDDLVPMTVTVRNDGPEVVRGFRLWIADSTWYPLYRPTCRGELSPWDESPLQVGESRDFQATLRCDMEEREAAYISATARLAGLDTNRSNDVVGFQVALD